MWRFSLPVNRKTVASFHHYLSHSSNIKVYVVLHEIPKLVFTSLRGALRITVPVKERLSALSEITKQQCRSQDPWEFIWHFPNFIFPGNIIVIIITFFTTISSPAAEVTYGRNEPHRILYIQGKKYLFIRMFIWILTFHCLGLLSP